MKKLNDEKTFLINLQQFKICYFWTIPYIKWWFKQCTLYKSTPVTALSVSFQNFVSMLHTY